MLITHPDDKTVSLTIYNPLTGVMVEEVFTSSFLFFQLKISVQFNLVDFAVWYCKYDCSIVFSNSVSALPMVHFIKFEEHRVIFEEI